MANDEHAAKGSDSLKSGQTGEVASTRITIEATDPVVETVVRRQPEGKQHRDHSASAEHTARDGKPEATPDRDARDDRNRERGRGDAQVHDQDRDEYGPQRADDSHEGQRDDADRDPKREEDGRGRQEGQPRTKEQPRSTMTHLLITAAVALICGVIGAMGYSYLFGPKAAEDSSSQSKAEAGSKKESGPKTKSGGGSDTKSTEAPGTKASTASAIPGVSPAQEVVELKQQMRNLNQKIDRLGERVDRLQQLLSLAVPLLQRIAPKE